MKELEANGVGRPSTYASILSTIQEREYVKKEGGRFTPDRTRHGCYRSSAGELRRHLRREIHRADGGGLDEIEDGKLDWRAAMAGVLRAASRRISSMPKRNMTDIKRMEKPTDLICEKCGKPMVIKWGSHGSFSPAPAIPNAPTPGSWLSNSRISPGRSYRGRRRVLRKLRSSHGSQKGPVRAVLCVLRLPGL